MIPKECKRLAEVDFPIAVVSKHSAREKSIRHGHPSTLHLWWARRPLAACRAMLMALLLPDPCDKHCPGDFKQQARALLQKTQGIVGSSDIDLRKGLLDFIGDFSNWDNSSHPVYLEVSRGLVKAAHPEETPLVVDPFAGGGSIPLEALRLGCEAFASDLNPVACLILKVMLEDIPRHGPELAEELRRVGKEIKEKAEKELAEFYPKDPDGATPIAYLWARTVRCESPNCGAEIPLMRSFWLCKKANRKIALRYTRTKDDIPQFEIFEPKSEKEVQNGTVTRAKATCLCCGSVLPPERVRAQLSEQKGGADVIFDSDGMRTGGARLTAVVTLREGETGRFYRLPNKADYQAVYKAQQKLKHILEVWEKNGKQGLYPVPDESLPPIGTLGFRVQRYGMLKWGDLFSLRQLVSNIVLVNQLQNVSAPTIKILISLLIGKGSDGNSSLCRWMATGENPVNQFSRQALPIVWDYCESSPKSQARGVYLSSINDMIQVINKSQTIHIGQVQQLDACESTLPSATTPIWFTDPPYYDAIPYSDLSDFFLTWLKRSLNNQVFLRDPFDPENPLSPKIREAVQDETRIVDGHPKNREFFEKIMAKAFTEGRRILTEDGIGSVVFAHKTTEGWEALLSGMTVGGWTITGSWPIATEAENRLRARDSAALATSVHLICRPRPEDAPIGDWGEVLKELPIRVGDWIERLQSEGVRGADLVFACIGPALEIFSRYSRVEDAAGNVIPLGGDPESKIPHKRGYLAYVWETVGRVALEQVLGTAEAKARNGAAGALEEDSRLTALFLWTLQTTDGQGGGETGTDEPDDDTDDDDGQTASRGKGKGFSLAYDVVRRFAQPLGISLPVWEDRIIKTEKGVVRLLGVSERAEQLFGGHGAEAVATWIEESPTKNLQPMLFPDMNEKKPVIRGPRGRRKISVDASDLDMDKRHKATNLDRVHAAMLLQAGGQANALRELIRGEQQRGPDFLRLANALSALYPKESEEKRLLDAMLLGVPK